MEVRKFEDLEFESHPRGFGSQAKVSFPNGYGASIVFGEMFYSNGVDSYELAVFYNGSLTYETPITEDVLGYLSKDEVVETLNAIKAYALTQGEEDGSET